MTITEFLTARLDEDEATARASEFPAEWVARPDMTNQPIMAGGYRIATSAASVMGHIARHDPARVLADVAAKRAIVALHSASDGRDPSCSSIDYPELAEDCETLRAMLQPFADHPDYDKAWRV